MTGRSLGELLRTAFALTSAASIDLSLRSGRITGLASISRSCLNRFFGYHQQLGFARLRYTLKYRPSSFEKPANLRGSIHAVINISSVVLVQAQAQLLNFTAERHVFTKPEMKIDQKSRLMGGLKGI